MKLDEKGFEIFGAGDSESLNWVSRKPKKVKRINISYMTREQLGKVIHEVREARHTKTSYLIVAGCRGRNLIPKAIREIAETQAVVINGE